MDENFEKVVLADFGLTRQIGLVSTACGTTTYMSPGISYILSF